MARCVYRCWSLMSALRWSCIFLDTLSLKTSSYMINKNSFSKKNLKGICKLVTNSSRTFTVT